MSLQSPANLGPENSKEEDAETSATQSHSPPSTSPSLPLPGARHWTLWDKIPYLKSCWGGAVQTYCPVFCTTR